MKRNARPLLLVAVVALFGCGGGSQQTTPPAIVVTITTAPPASLGVGGTAGVAATVVNDTANAGVTWSCTPSSTCGSFNPVSTASGASTTYTAPATAPAGGSAVIIATSVTDHAKSANASVMIVGIVVTLSTPPPTSLAGGGTASVAATVANDSAAAGVNWSCTPSTTCGSFTPTSTASGASTTYTAPAVAPAGGSVVIIATSVTDPTKNAQSAAVTITGTASNATLNGKYVLHLTAATGNQQGPSVIAASLTADGNGLITGGVEELTAPGFYDLVDVVTDGTYSIDPNGHGTMLIHTVNLEALRFSFVLTSPTHALMVEVDGDPASGTLDKQQPAGTGGFTAAQISGNYSFLLDGIDNTAPLNHMSVAGTFAADGVGALTSSTLDINNGGTFTTASSTGIFTAPDTNGRGHLIMNGRDFVYYIISSKVLRLLEGDNISFVGGSAYAQGSAGSTMAALSGKFVYQHHRGVPSRLASSARTAWARSPREFRIPIPADCQPRSSKERRLRALT